MSEKQQSLSDFTKYENMFLDLKNKNRFSRLGRAFSTNSSRYFYDTGTGKVFQINDNVYNVLRCLSATDDFNKLYELDMSSSELFESLKEIEQTVKNENILLALPVETMACSEKDYIEKSLQSLKQLELEVTERCNLRCKYCVYQEGQGAFRNFGENDMSLDTAKKAIDLLALRSDDEVNISFYGGEPLLRFDLIKQCISYCNDKFSNKTVYYNMTTNCTLMTPEIAGYLASVDNFTITVSLDGPECIHDKNRVFINGTGSFDKTINGLKNLIIAYGDNASKRININTVIENPEHEIFDEIQGFFNNAEWLPKGIGFSNSYVATGDVDSEYLGVDTEEDRAVLNKFEESNGDIDPLTDWSMNLLTSEKYTLENNPLISKDSIDKELSYIHKRILVDEPMKFYSMNGCCVPGARRLYVTVNGDFMICEKMGPSPYIGNVDEGINIAEIKKHYINDFINEATKYCNDCWAINLCSLCYMNCFDKDGIHISYRHSTCTSNRWILEKDLIKYHEIMETDPTSLNYLNEFTLS
ncbi:radical SAM protein [Romboutsia sedimentorum]|uniref:radical SAM protein n=1 Tax=Romboutsia sedimentorum TaxID=1368474 RepID=UPI0024DEBE4B|nr:radical SAM protein [Romboutsia sedimentorum]MDK2587344.1 radical SAM protein [Romboutsia sedimentorum]